MNRRVVSLAGGACAVLLIAWFLLLWAPKGAELAAAEKRQSAADTQVSELHAKLARLQDAQRRAPQLTADLERIRSAVPAKPDLAAFILDADDAATAAHVNFMAITPASPAPSTSGAASEVKLDLTLKGGYFQILDFLDRLQDLPRIVVLDDVAVAYDQESGGLTASLKGRMFNSQAPAPPDGEPTTTTVQQGEKK